MFKDTYKFREAAIFFDKYGHYDCGTKGSVKYKKYWAKEKDRCRYGYRVDGVWITGTHYYYLNYCRMEKVVKTLKGDKASKASNRVFEFPDFWDVDYIFFMCCHIARWGVASLDPVAKSPEEWDYDRGYAEYKKLPVDLNLIETKENLSGGRYLLWLKPRGVGASWKGAALASKNFHLVPKMKSFMFADDKEYLIKDGIYNKFLTLKSFLDKHTDFGVTCEDKASLTQMHYRGSYTTNGKTRGTESEVIGVSFKNDPEKARGKRGILALWEEFGKFPDAHVAWNIARSSFEEGESVFGLMLAFGTGGSEGNDFYSMKTMSKSPDAYGVLAFNNIWDKGMEGQPFCLFTPAYYNVSFKDEHGNSTIEEAKASYEKKREQAMLSPDPALIERVKAEGPFTPQEAMLNTISNIFMVEGMGDHTNRVTSDPKIRVLGVPKVLYRQGEEIKARLADRSEDHAPILTYPHDSKGDLHGTVIEWSTPVKQNDKVLDDLYLIGHDPFAEDDVQDVTSLGAAYVYMNPTRLVPGGGDRIVASWVGRPRTTDEYNEILFMLAERWNAKIGYENERGDVLGYAKRFNLTHWLAEEFELAWDEKITIKRKSAYKYGMRIGSGKTNVRLLTGNRYIADWLITPRGENVEGRHRYNYHGVYDPALLEEFIAYDGVKNADRISAFRIVMYYAKELAYNDTQGNQRKITNRNSSITHFFRPHLYGN